MTIESNENIDNISSNGSADNMPKGDNENIENNAGVNDSAESKSKSDQEAAKKRRERLALLSGKVIDYADAPDDIRERMEEMMRPIAEEPNNSDIIATYGSAPLKKLGEFANEMMEVQKRFDSQVNTVAGLFDQMQNTFRDMGLMGLAGKVKDWTAAASQKGSKGLKGIWNVVTFKNAKKAQGKKMLVEVQSSIPEMNKKMNVFIQQMERAKDSIDTVIAEVLKTGRKQFDSNQEILLYLGTQNELLRRYEQEYIPEALAENEDDATAGTKEYLDAVTERRDDLLARMSGMEASRLKGTVQMQSLMQVVQDLRLNKKIIIEFLENGQHDWRMMMVSAGFAASGLKSAQNVENMGKFNDEMMAKTINMIEVTSKTLSDARVRGIGDPQKLIAASDAMVRLIENAGVEAQRRKILMQQNQVKLRDAGNKVIEAVRKEESRLLGSSSAASDSDANNDNSVKKPTMKRLNDKNGSSPT